MKPPPGWRKDVIYKAVLRKVRKEYLNDFNQQTRFILTRRSRKNEYYTEKLLEYTRYLMGSNKDSNLESELVFFLGSIFYPKHLKKIHTSSLKTAEIDNIHSCLY